MPVTSNPETLAPLRRMTGHFVLRRSFRPPTGISASAAGLGGASGGSELRSLRSAKWQGWRVSTSRKSGNPGRAPLRGFAPPLRPPRISRFSLRRHPPALPFRSTSLTPFAPSLRSCPNQRLRPKCRFPAKTTVSGQNDRSSGSAAPKFRDSLKNASSDHYKECIERSLVVLPIGVNTAGIGYHR